MVTLDQSVAHLESMALEKAAQAASLRKLGEDYKRAANATDDAQLRRTQFDSASRLFGDARACDRDVDAILTVIRAVR